MSICMNEFYKAFKTTKWSSPHLKPRLRAPRIWLFWRGQAKTKWLVCSTGYEIIKDQQNDMNNNNNDLRFMDSAGLVGHITVPIGDGRARGVSQLNLIHIKPLQDCGRTRRNFPTSAEQSTPWTGPKDTRQLHELAGVGGPGPCPQDCGFPRSRHGDRWKCPRLLTFGEIGHSICIGISPIFTSNATKYTERWTA